LSFETDGFNWDCFPSGDVCVDFEVAVAPKVYLTLKSVTVVRSLLKLVRKGIEACGVFSHSQPD
jgi:hypothetical protein